MKISDSVACDRSDALVLAGVHLTQDYSIFYLGSLAALLTPLSCVAEPKLFRTGGFVALPSRICPGFSLNSPPLPLQYRSNLLSGNKNF